MIDARYPTHHERVPRPMKVYYCAPDELFPEATLEVDTVPVYCITTKEKP